MWDCREVDHIDFDPSAWVQIHFFNKKQSTHQEVSAFFLAEDVGFEPTMELPPNRLSKAAP